MEIIKNLNSYNEENGLAITIGNFDGVHIGHQKIINKVIELGRKDYLKTAALTFYPHPMQFFGAGIDVLLSERKKIALLNNFKLDYLFILHFDETFSGMPAEVYVKELLVKKLKVKDIVVGYDFRFGKRRSGNYEVLKLLSGKYDYTAVKIDKIEFSDVIISSTNVRKYLAEGDVLFANKLLGRPYSLEGVVIKGRGLGKLLGFPTANIDVREGLLPAYGVYATKTIVEGKGYHSVTSIGIRPTIRDNGSLSVETMIFGFDKNIYGKFIEIEFIKHIRGEIKFPSLDELTLSMKKDVQNAKDILKDVS